MVGRPPIETWNRGELEDKYLKVYYSEFELKKKNKFLENELKKQNTKIRKKIAGENNDESSEQQIAINSLKHEKEILIQKMTALKQQLLAYTTPQMRQVGLNLLTSRPTNMATLRTLMTTGGRHSAKMIIGTGKLNNKQNEEINDLQNVVIDKNVQLIDKEKISSNSLNLHLNDNDLTTENRMLNNGMAKKSLGKESDNNVNMQNSEKEICSQLKINYIKVNRELRAKNDEAILLQKELEDKILMINNLQQELNNLVNENNILKKENKLSNKTLKDLEKKLQLNIEGMENNIQSPTDIMNNFENGKSKVEKPVLEAEIRQLKDEIHSLKEINERLIKNSFEQENSRKVKIDQLNSLKGTIETLNEKIGEFKSSNEELEKRIQYLNIEKKALEKHLTNISHNIDINKSNLELKTVLNELSQIGYSKENTINLNKNVNYLFDNINIMLKKYAEEDGLTDNKDYEYKKMFEEMHEEMEKLRNLLVLQHSINEKQVEEIKILKMNNRLLSEELTKRKLRIEEINTKHNLEINKLKGQINKKYDLPYNIDVYPGPFPSIQSHEIRTINEMSVILKGIQFDEGFFTNSQTIYFISLEFFNFEILTTPTFSGLSRSFEYTAIYDLLVSELLVYYMENEGIHVELYKVIGSDCSKLGSGIILLKSLFTTPKVLENDVIIYNLNDKVEIGSIRYNIILTDAIFECIKEGYKNLYFNDNIKDVIKENISTQPLSNNKIIEDNKNNINISSVDNSVPFNDTKQFIKKEKIPTIIDKQKESSKSNTSKESKKSTISKNSSKDKSIQLISKPKKESNSESSDEELNVPEICINVDIYSISNITKITNNPNITTFIAYQIPGHQAFLSDPVKGPNPMYNCHKEWNISINNESINNLKKESIFIYIVDADKCSKTLSDNNIFEEAVLCYSNIDVNNMELNKPLYGDFDTYLGNGKKSEIKLRLAIYIGVRKEEKDFFDKPLGNFIDENKKEEFVKDNTLNKNNMDIYGSSKTSSTTSSDTRTYTKNDSPKEDRKESHNNKISYENSLVKTSIKKTLPKQLKPIVVPRTQKVNEESASSNSSIVTVTEMKVGDSKSLDSLPQITTSINVYNSDNENDTDVEKSTERGNFINSPEVKSCLDSNSLKSDKTSVSKSSDRNETPHYKKGVGFMSPLHHSISPSNSITSNSSFIKSEKKVKLLKKKEPSLYDNEMMKSIKPITHYSTSMNNNENDASQKATLYINVMSFFTTENFYYIYGNNIKCKVFFEWQIIDINHDLCETKQSFPIPRYPNIPVFMENKNKYILTNRQVELLEQWQELGNKLTFTMVSDPGDDGECDDIGMASMDLQYIGIGHLIELKVFSNEGDWVASVNVDVNINYI
uniref:C2-C2_1 domain-containing protein n=1 Tax=Strongyloides papillosus TaxID=174720 RepID=A0A0N5C6V3_STREA